MKAKIIQIQDVTVDELEVLISKTVANAIHGLKNEIEISNKRASDPERLLNVNEVCELLQISRVTLWNWVTAKKFNVYGTGQKRYFKYNEVMSAIEKRK